MKNTRFNGLLLLGLVVSCVTAISACAATPASDSDFFSQRSVNTFDPATIDAIGDKVANWQVANLDDLGDLLRRLREGDRIGERRSMIGGILPMVLAHRFGGRKTITQQALQLPDDRIKLAFDDTHRSTYLRDV